MDKDLAERSWAQVRHGVDAKLLPRDGEVYVLAQSRNGLTKEQAMRRRQWRLQSQFQPPPKISAQGTVVT